MELEIIVLDEISQILKPKGHIISHMWNWRGGGHKSTGGAMKEEERDGV
jgi:hypothetical protein